MLASLFFGASAQEQNMKVKISNLERETTLVDNITTSSSTSSVVPNFPVVRGGVQEHLNFEDVDWIIVRHDLPPSDPNRFISVELEFRDGRSGLYEMVKYIRFSGKAGEDSFSIKLMNINTVEVVHKR